MCPLRAETRTRISISLYDNDIVMYIYDFAAQKMLYIYITRNKYAE